MMEEPWKPFNVRPKLSWWQRHHEECGMFLWILAITLASAMLILTFDGVEAWFR
jgi:hypothetical protein